MAHPKKYNEEHQRNCYYLTKVSGKTDAEASAILESYYGINFPNSSVANNRNNYQKITTKSDFAQHLVEDTGIMEECYQQELNMHDDQWESIKNGDRLFREGEVKTLMELAYSEEVDAILEEYEDNSKQRIKVTENFVTDDGVVERETTMKFPQNPEPANHEPDEETETPAEQVEPDTVVAIRARVHSAFMRTLEEEISKVEIRIGDIFEESDMLTKSEIIDRIAEYYEKLKSDVVQGIENW